MRVVPVRVGGSGVFTHYHDTNGVAYSPAASGAGLANNKVGATSRLSTCYAGNCMAVQLSDPIEAPAVSACQYDLLPFTLTPAWSVLGAHHPTMPHTSMS